MDSPIVKCSDDAGRFVCNFTLFKTLFYLLTYSSPSHPPHPAYHVKKDYKAAFIHLPMFELIDAETQALALWDIFNEIANQECSNKD